MNIAVFGLGYVGCVSAACLAREGHQVIGVDINREKIDTLKGGKSPIIEPELEQIIEVCVRSGSFVPTSDGAHAVKAAEVIMICVGTPSKNNGSIELSQIERVVRQVGRFLSEKESYSVVVIRSTLLPGMISDTIVPVLAKESGKEVGFDFGVCVNPEFLREGSSISDFYAPPFTVIGELDSRSGELLAKAYSTIDAPIHRVPFGVAEMVKYASNCFHALKVVFANEIGSLCQAHSVDSHNVMDIFCQDTKLNLSPYYLKPGYAFGGSCLPKDLRAMLFSARRVDVQVPVIDAIITSNTYQKRKALELVIGEGRKKVAILGLGFKQNTDDLRESPAVELAEQLIGKGYELKIYDREVTLSSIHGSNREYIERILPHIERVLQPSIGKTVEGAETIVITKRLVDEEQREVAELVRADQTIINLAHHKWHEMEGLRCKCIGIT